MYKYRLKEEPNGAKKFQQERIDAFDELETKMASLIKTIQKGKVETIKYYKSNPDSYGVAYPTDLIADYINDIEDLLTSDNE